MIGGDDIVATVVITTCNRKADLERCLLSCASQTAQVEVIVVDDHSEDGTAEFVRQQFPQVRLFVNDAPVGYIVGRNKGAAEASSPIIYSIDDDAEFADVRTIETSVRYFEDPIVAALALPYVNVGTGNELTQRPPDDRPWVVYAFVGTAHALRRDLFLAFGGYEARFFHQGEEIDLCERLRAAGYVIRLVDTEPIRHHISPVRNYRRMDIYGLRNAMLTGWRNAPAQYLPAYWARAIAKAALGGARAGRWQNILPAIATGVSAVARARDQRNPVSSQAWKLSRELRAHGPLLLESVRGRLR